MILGRSSSIGLTLVKQLLSKSVRRGMSSTHVERTANSFRDETFSWVTVESIHQLSSTVKGFTLRAAASETRQQQQECRQQLCFLAGQWVDLHVPAVNVVGGYSIVSPPHQLAEEQTLELAIKHSDHPPTLWMTTKCEVGNRLMIRIGGNFHYSPRGKEVADLLLIGGGVGINPLFSMLSHHAKLLSDDGMSQEGHVRLLYSSKTEDELLFKERIDRIAASKAEVVKVQYFVTASDEASDDSSSDPTVKRGRVSGVDVVNAVKGLERERLQCYLCGPSPMTESMTHTLLTHCGLDSSHIHYERWW